MTRFIVVICILLLMAVTGIAHAEETVFDPVALIKSGKIVPIITLFVPDRNCSEGNPHCIMHEGNYYRKNGSASPKAAGPLSIKAGPLIKVSFKNNDSKDYYCYIVKKTGSATTLLNKGKFVATAGKISEPLAGFIIDKPGTDISWYLSDKPLDLLQFDSSFEERGGIVIVPPVDLISGK